MDTYQIPWDLRRRGAKDASRHDIRVKDAIRKNLRELISQEDIIASDGQRTIKIPLRYLDQYRFKYGTPEDGVGHGEGNVGDVLGRRDDGPSPGTGPPGDQPGDHAYEVDVTIDDLAQMALEDLALPWLEATPAKELVTTSPRFTDIRKIGSLANLDKRRSLRENLKRQASKGNAHVGPFVNDDLRFKVWDEHEERQARAAVYCAIDVSGSMSTEKKFIAKVFFFWMVRFLRLKYRNVETVFIAHDTQAHIVPEKDFFAITEGGGTMCSSAYALALKNILHHHPSSSWNAYLFHFSDGDNFGSDNTKCVEIVTELLKHCRMVGYGEIRYKDEASWYGSSGSGYEWSTLQKSLNTILDPHLLSIILATKDDVWKALERFLRVKEGEVA